MHFFWLFGVGSKRKSDIEHRARLALSIAFDVLFLCFSSCLLQVLELIIRSWMRRGTSIQAFPVLSSSLPLFSKEALLTKQIGLGGSEAPEYHTSPTVPRSQMPKQYDIPSLQLQQT